MVQPLIINRTLLMTGKKIKRLKSGRVAINGYPSALPYATGAGSAL